MPAVNFTRIRILLEPDTLEVLDELVQKVGHNRTKLIRMCVKTVLSDPSITQQVISNGDGPLTKKKGSKK